MQSIDNIDDIISELSGVQSALNGIKQYELAQRLDQCRVVLKLMSCGMCKNSEGSRSDGFYCTLFGPKIYIGSKQ